MNKRDRERKRDGEERWVIFEGVVRKSVKPWRERRKYMREKEHERERDRNSERGGENRQTD
jgi:hypothetical protein